LQQNDPPRIDSSLGKRFSSLPLLIEAPDPINHFRP
jgi:hypothetical protein